MRNDLLEMLLPLIGPIANLLVPFNLAVVLFAVFLGTLIPLLPERHDYAILDLRLTTIIYSYFGMIVGARLFWVLFNFKELTAQPIRFLFLWTGGFSTFGAFAGASLVAFAILRYHQKSFGEFTDRFAPSAAFVLMLAKLGCLLSGCCQGRPTSWWWGISFPRETMAWTTQVKAGLISDMSARSLPVHPTQVLEAVAAALILVVLLVVRQRTRKTGTSTWMFVLLYGVFRFFIEFLRGDERPIVVGPITLSHFLALIMVATAIVALHLRRSIQGSDKAEPLGLHP